MSQLRTYRFFTSVTTTAASATYFTDFRFEDIPDRTIQGALTSGAKVEIYTYASRSDDAVPYLVSTFTSAQFKCIIDHPVAKIRTVMVSGGTATVEGLV